MLHLQSTRLRRKKWHATSRAGRVRCLDISCICRLSRHAAGRLDSSHTLLRCAHLHSCCWPCTLPGRTCRSCQGASAGSRLQCSASARESAVSKRSMRGKPGRVDLKTCLIAGSSRRECCSSTSSSSSSTNHQPSSPVTRVLPAQLTLLAGVGHGSHHAPKPVRLSSPLQRASRNEYAASELPGHSTQRSAWGLLCLRSRAKPRGHSVMRLVRGPSSSVISTSHLEPSTLGINCAPSVGTQE